MIREPDKCNYIIALDLAIRRASPTTKVVRSSLLRPLIKDGHVSMSLMLFFASFLYNGKKVNMSIIVANFLLGKVGTGKHT